MEVPIISRVSGFGAGINWLHSPSLFSRVFARSGIDEVSTLRSFWTWGALILAVVATFSSILKRTKVILIRLQKVNSVISQPFYTDESDEEEDDDCSSASSDGESDDEVRFRTPKARYEDQGFGAEADFRVADSGGVNSVHDVTFDFRPRFPCLAGTAGEHPFSRNVVKLWDGLGFGSESSGKSVSIWDTNRMEKIRSFFTELPAICSPLPSASPAVVVSAGGDETRKVRMSVWDLRTAGDAPAMVAQWEPRGCRRELFGMASGLKEKVYVGDGVKSVTVRDLRNVETAFGETEEVTWFDADAVMIDGPATAPLRCTSTSRTNLKRGSINGSVCK